jgi:hypothetical protein
MAGTRIDPTNPTLRQIRRWHDAAQETDALLRENDELMHRRSDLFRKRALLLRDIVHASRTFVEDAVAGPAKRS